MVFSIKLIIVIVLLFATVTIIVNFVNNNLNKNHSIELVNESFSNLMESISAQISSHNSDNDYLQAIQNNYVSRRLVSSTDYTFSRMINVRYNYDIYDMNANPIYQESYHLLPQYKIYLNIIRDRVRKDSPVKFILYPSFKTNTATLIFYGGLYKDGELIGFDMYSIEITDLDYALLPNTGDYVITDRFDGIISTNNNKLLEKSLNFKYAENYTIGAQKYTVTEVKKDFYSIYYLEKKISLSLSYLIVFSLLLAIALVVVAFTNNIVTKIARENTRSFESIIADTNRVSKGHLDHRINEDLEDDFKSLAININEMLEKLNYEITLNKELSETNIIFEKRKLDAQFNPHFLYNSLETIRYSMQYDIKGTEKYILDLTAILRYSISNDINYSSLEKDLTYTEKFLNLYKYRFADKLTYSIRTSEETRDVSIPKLALHPLVSNSIKYGFTNSLSVNIDITSELINGVCFIRVRDNGVNITDEVINEINQICKQKKNPSNHIGVHNVLRRFMILYPDSRLNVWREDEGTVFEISFNKSW
ncbi:sensor histidine kinase [Spirochaeta isovalerica]|uniref:Sensor histidine kinase YesM n=1 Tax=Spirochaeta isovalerica TaxID=150 RepID=A0A841R7R7_9SPIO|nr:histidine kinase [Spirochaeta isovalerica]MBB6479903.1 sensor histidine kinase YesM [Spirochaeta isovalerica]